MDKVLVLDMDGTIYDLYSVENWLSDLRAERVRPYEVGSPLVNLDDLNLVIEMLKACGWKIVVTSWTAKGGSHHYNKEVARVKKEWIYRCGIPVDEIHIVKYGTTKANCTRKLGGYQVLVDDNAEIRDGWTLGATIDPTENLIEQLIELL